MHSRLPSTPCSPHSWLLTPPVALCSLCLLGNWPVESRYRACMCVAIHQHRLVRHHSARTTALPYTHKHKRTYTYVYITIFRGMQGPPCTHTLTATLSFRTCLSLCPFSRCTNATAWDGVIFLHEGVYAGACFKFRVVIPPKYPDTNVPVRAEAYVALCGYVKRSM